MFWQVVVPGTQTVTVTKATLMVPIGEPLTDGPASTIIGTEFNVAVVGVTVTVALPETLVFCTEVAVTVTEVEVETVGAVRTPDEFMVPALELNVTAELKFPVPLTVAEHVLVPPEVTVEGEQLTWTEVTVEDEPPLPPQAANHITLPSKKASPSLRTISLLQRMSLAATPCGINCGM